MTTISFFSSSKDNAPKVVDVAPNDLADGLGLFAQRTAKDGPCWSPVRYELGASRSNANVRGVSCLVFDLDDVTTARLGALKSILKAFSVLHSSFSDDPSGDRCLRLIFPLVSEVPTAAFAALRQAVIARYNIPADPATSDPARVYYLPTCQPGRTPYYEILQGPLLDPADFAVRGYDVSRFARLSKPESQDMADTLLAGKPLATSNRDAAMQKAASIVAFTYPEWDVARCVDFAKPSIAAMPSDNELQWELDKFERKVTRAKARQETAAANDAELTELLGKSKAPEGGYRYSSEEIAGWAREQGVSESEFARRWIIQCGTAFFVFKHGVYQSPVGKDELKLKLRDDLALAPIPTMTIGTTPGGKAKPRPMTTEELLHNYGTASRNLYFDMSIDRSKYDSSQDAFFYAICQRRPFAATYHQDVNDWLVALGGAQANKLLDWLACLTFLNQQCAALLIEGDSGAGKGLLSTGIARLWTVGAPVDFESAVGDFNSALTRCPFVYVDEGFPHVYGKDLNNTLRTLIGSQERMLRQKYIPDSTLRGALRLMIASNNNHTLNGLSEMSMSDRHAIAQRLIFVPVTDGKARDLLNAMTPAQRSEWAEQKIPEHLCWLRDNRAVVPGKRFVVEGADQMMQTIDRLMVSVENNSRMFQVIANTIANVKSPADRTSWERHLQYGGGTLLVAPTLPKAAWENVHSDRAPGMTDVYKCLQSISTTLHKKDGAYFYEVPLTLVQRWVSMYPSAEADLALERILR